MHFRANQIDFKCFSDIVFVPWGIISLVYTSKTHKSKIVQTPGGKRKSKKNKIVKGYKKGVVSLRHLTSSIHNQLEITNTSNWMLSWIQFYPYTLNCGDWFPLDLGAIGFFLTKITITFVALISPNFWGGHTHPFLYHFLE